MNSINSKYGWLVGFPTVLFTEIYQEMGLEFKSDSNKWFVHFDEVKPLWDDLYEAKMKKATFLIDDADENIIRYFWRSKKDQRSIARFISRNDHISSLWASSLDNERIKTNPFLNRYLNSPIFYISDNDDSLSLPSFKETFKTNEITGKKTVSYIQDGLVTTPTEGWSMILGGSYVDDLIPVFENKEEDLIMKCYGESISLDDINPNNLWLREFIQAVKKLGTQYLPYFNYQHFPTANEYQRLRRSLVWTNKVKVVLKFPGNLFTDRKDNEPVYFIVNTPSERSGWLGHILLGDFSTKTNQSLAKKSIDYCIAFLQWNTNVIYGSTGMKIITPEKLKEPCLLDPTLYVK